MRTWTHALPLLALVTLPALTALEGSAAAQPKRPGPPPAAAAAAAAAAAGPQADAKKATALFLKGTDLYNAKKWAPALDAFRASYAAVPSPNSHLYIARCMAALGDTKGAYLEFDKVFAEADLRSVTEAKYVPTRDSARTERDELGSRLALITLNVAHADASTTVRVGPDDVPLAHWASPYPVMPGSVDVVVQSANRPPVTKTLTFAAGDKREIALDAAPVAAPAPVVAVAPPPRKKSSRAGLRPYAYAAGGVGVLGVGLFAVSGVLAHSTFNDLNGACAGGPCPSNRASDISKGKTEQTLANVGLIVGAVGIAAGVTLFVLSSGGSVKNTQGTRTEVLVGPGYSGVRGEF